MKKGIIVSLALAAVVGLLLGCQGVLGKKEIKIGVILTHKSKRVVSRVVLIQYGIVIHVCGGA